MDRAPLPPHERSWRHPSEIAAEERAALQAESLPGSTRALALTSGTLGLLAVGLLVLIMSPRQHDQPIAVGVTTTPALSGVVTTIEASFATTPAAIRSPAAAIGRWRGAESLTVTPSTGSGLVLATPFDDGTRAVLTRTSAGGRDGGDIEVRLASGRSVDAEIVAVSGDIVVVELDEPSPGHPLAAETPAGGEIVTVMAEPPVTVVLDDVDELSVADGTAVLDGHGDLVGLCVHASDDETTLVDVGAALRDLDD